MMRTPFEARENESYEESLARLREYMRLELEADMQEAEAAEAKSRERPAHQGLKQAFLYTLIRRRFELRLSQSELARRAEIPRTVLARVEGGKGNPTLKTLLSIITALGATLEVQSDRIVESK